MTEKEKLQVDKILEESRKRRLASAKLLSQMGGQGNLAPPGGFMRPQPQVFDLRTQELQQSESKPQKPQPIVSDLNPITPWEQRERRRAPHAITPEELGTGGQMPAPVSQVAQALDWAETEIHTETPTEASPKQGSIPFSKPEEAEPVVEQSARDSREITRVFERITPEVIAKHQPTLYESMAFTSNIPNLPTGSPPRVPVKSVPAKDHPVPSAEASAPAGISADDRERTPLQVPPLRTTAKAEPQPGQIQRSATTPLTYPVAVRPVSVTVDLLNKTPRMRPAIPVVRKSRFFETPKDDETALAPVSPAPENAENPPEQEPETPPEQAVAFNDIFAQPPQIDKTSGLDWNARLFTAEEPENVDEEYRPRRTLTDFDDSEAQEDPQEIKAELLSRRNTITARVVFSALIFVVLVFALLVPLGNPGLFAQNNLVAYVFISVNAALLLVSMVVNRSTMAGLFSLFAFRPDYDTPTALASAAAFLHTATALLVPSLLGASPLCLFPSLGALAVLFNAIGKYHMISRIKLNYDLVLDGGQDNTVTIIDSPEVLRSLTRESVFGSPALFVSRPAEELRGFLTHSFCADPSDFLSRRMTFVSIAAALVAGASAFVTGKEHLVAVSVFVGVLCALLCVTAVLICNYQLYRVSRKLRSKGAVITGYDAVEAYLGAGAIAIGCQDLFPAGSIQLRNIKATGKVPVDAAILDSGAVAAKLGGCLYHVFSGILEGKTQMLPLCENALFLAGEGLCGQVEGREILVGNRTLMERQGVAMPDRDVDNKILRAGYFPLHIASGGMLAATFILDYKADAQIADELYRLENSGVKLLLQSRDPNLDEHNICAFFGLDRDSVTLLPDAASDIFKAATAPLIKADCLLTHNGGVKAFIASVSACVRLARNTSIATVIQTLLAVLGAAVCIVLAFTNRGALTAFPLLGFAVGASLMVYLIGAALSKQ